MENHITTINQNSKVALVKSKNLLELTKALLSKPTLLQQAFSSQPYLLEHGHSASVTAIAITPDGKTIATAYKNSLNRTFKPKSFLVYGFYE